jgi:hypothetical protein
LLKLKLDLRAWNEDAKTGKIRRLTVAQAPQKIMNDFIDLIGGLRRYGVCLRRQIANNALHTGLRIASRRIGTGQARVRQEGASAAYIRASKQIAAVEEYFSAA